MSVKLKYDSWVDCWPGDPWTDSYSGATIKWTADAKVRDFSATNKTVRIDFYWEACFTGEYAYINDRYNYSITCGGNPNGHTATAHCKFGSLSTSWTEMDDDRDPFDNYWSGVTYSVNSAQDTWTASIYTTFTGTRWNGNSFEASQTLDLPSFYKISYSANGGSGAPGEQYKIENINLTLSNTVPSWENHEFLGWNTKSDGSGTNYTKGTTYTSNGPLTLYAQWKELGAKIKVTSNSYNTNSNPWFPNAAKYITAYNSNTGLTVSNIGPYPSSTGQIALKNQASYDYSVMPVPYYDSREINFLGYYTGGTFASSNVQIFSPTNWIDNSKKVHLAKATGDGTYFQTSTGNITNSNVYNWDNEEVTIVNNWVIPQVGSQVSGNIALPKWNKSDGNTYEFYALWSKPNLTFTFDPDNGKSEQQKQVVLIGTPGFASTPGTTQNYIFPSSLNYENIFTPVTGKYLTGDWETRPAGQDPIDGWYDIANNQGFNLALGGYVTDTTFYAKWKSFKHLLKISLDGDDNIDNATNFVSIIGGNSYNKSNFTNLETLINNYKTQNNTPDATFYGLYTKARGGSRIFGPDGTPDNDGIYFINNVWAYRTENKLENTPVLLYAHWVPDTNVQLNISLNPRYPNWKFGYIYINKNANNPNGKVEWERVSEVTFIEN